MSASIGERIVITLVFGLITYIPYTSQLYVWIPWLKENNGHLYVILCIYNIFILSIWTNYLYLLITTPGYPPSTWKPIGNMTELKKSKRKPRYCQICRQFKPPRSHHCSNCDKCICKMDHHCPWIGGCVGYNNQGHFVRFLISVSLGTFMTLILHSWRIYDWSYYPYNPWIHSNEGFKLILFLMSNFFLALIVFVPVTFLAVNHVYYVINNLTTIEDLEKNRSILVEIDGIIKEISKPYYIDKYTNVCAVLGRKWYLWWFPQRLLGKGVFYPIRPDAIGFDPSTEEVKEEKPLPSHVRRGSEGYEVDTMQLQRKLLGSDIEESDFNSSGSVSLVSDDDIPLHLQQLEKKDK